MEENSILLPLSPNFISQREATWHNFDASSWQSGQTNRTRRRGGDSMKFVLTDFRQCGKCVSKDQIVWNLNLDQSNIIDHTLLTSRMNSGLPGPPFPLEQEGW
jgi:hypothetical protein